MWTEPEDFRRVLRRERNLWEQPEIWAKWGRVGMELADKHMRQLLELCRRHGIALNIAVYPYQHPHIAEKRLESRQVLHWRQFCEENDVGFLNLFPVFIADRTPSETNAAYFIRGDAHWNEAGHALVAQAFLEWWPQRRAAAP